ncbi:MAG: hypothetical protein E6G41_16870 [Actinobacteria bacterium]|nr:MAG: hypothetical protein E6G41_16870 [Actinomycetota bacterium]
MTGPWTRGDRVEGAMGEEAVVADGDAEPGDHVHHGEDRDVAPVEQVGVPGQRRNGGQHDERAEHGGKVDVPVQAAHACT